MTKAESLPEVKSSNVSTHHLSGTAREALTLSDEERINRIHNARWIGYTRAAEILAKLDDLLSFPKKHRMPNLLLVGDTNNGKTMIINRFQSQNKSFDNADGGGVTLPVFTIQAPPVPDESRFYDEILMKLFAPFKFNEKVNKKQFQAIRILTRTNTKMLVIDEIHNIIAGNQSRQRQFLNTLKNLGNELQIPIVGVGTKDAFNAINTDPQLANRFEPMTLPRWTMNADFLRLLASFEVTLPLAKPSGLTDTSLATKLLSMSEGTIGELSTVLSRAAIQAIKSNQEHITLSGLERLNWIQPSERKRQAI
ncbi:MAG: TniB family NTP-binding protein [Pyrinomonadaceae bacterium MAG19_C2-C3]|nr:TniB family NTP-binding protein [Pyrinomonadaceae bacterium MAG19_C2-C3]